MNRRKAAGLTPEELRDKINALSRRIKVLSEKLAVLLVAKPGPESVASEIKKREQRIRTLRKELDWKRVGRKLLYVILQGHRLHRKYQALRGEEPTANRTSAKRGGAR